MCHISPVLSRDFVDHLKVLIAAFPYWPAVVFEPDDVAIHPALLKEYEEKKSLNQDGSVLYIVQFYDTRRTWYVVKCS